AASEAVLGLEPLHIRVEFKARKTALRLQGLENFKRTGRRRHTTALSIPGGDNSVFLSRRDRVETVFCFTTPYTIRISTKEDWLTMGENLLVLRGLVWYTDGSKTDSGTGAEIYGRSPGVRISVPLGVYPSVIQAELIAILACAQENLLRGFERKHIYICSDSRAALKELASAGV